MRKFTAVFIILLIALTVGVLPARATQTYYVQPGDTLFSIAARFNVSISELATINKIYDVNAISVGQLLTIPDALPGSNPAPAYVPPVVVGPQPPAYPAGTVVTTVTTYTYYVVQRGDFLASIATKFGTTAQAILSANYITNPNLIYVGQRLVIPKIKQTINIPRPKPVYGNLYVVQPGDNLYAIAARFNRDIYAIARANGLLNLNYIYSGMVLLIP